MSWLCLCFSYKRKELLIFYFILQLGCSIIHGDPCFSFGVGMEGRNKFLVESGGDGDEFSFGDRDGGNGMHPSCRLRLKEEEKSKTPLLVSEASL